MGEHAAAGSGPDAPVVVEADIEHGVRSVSVSSLSHLNARVCRPIGLKDADRANVCHYMLARLGNTDDLNNVVDLCRY